MGPLGRLPVPSWAGGAPAAGPCSSPRRAVSRGAYGGSGSCGVMDGLLFGSGCAWLGFGDVLLCTLVFMARTFMGDGSQVGQICVEGWWCQQLWGALKCWGFFGQTDEGRSKQLCLSCMCLLWLDAESSNFSGCGTGVRAVASAHKYWCWLCAEAAAEQRCRALSRRVCGGILCRCCRDACCWFFLTAQ